MNDMKSDDNRKSESLLDIVNRQRHDFMNDLQVLYGYIRLKKYDKLEVYVETIKKKAMRDSFIAKLGIPELSLFLYEFPIKHPNVQFEVVMEREVNLAQIPVSGHKLSQFLTFALDEFGQCDDADGVHRTDGINRLTVAIHGDASQLNLDIQYDGRPVSDPMIKALQGEFDARKEADWNITVASESNTTSVNIQIAFGT